MMEQNGNQELSGSRHFIVCLLGGKGNGGASSSIFHLMHMCASLGSLNRNFFYWFCFVLISTLNRGKKNSFVRKRIMHFFRRKITFCWN